MKTLRQYKKIKIGINKYKEPIYLTPPRFSCDWYWSFGWIGNKNLHTHLDSLEYWDKDKIKAIKEYFIEFVIKNSDLYKFIELVETIYQYKKHSELIYIGGSYYTKNPCKDIIKNADYYNSINNYILPQLFEEFYKLIEENLKYPKQCRQISEIMLEGNTKKCVDYLFENNLVPYDLILNDDKKTYKKTFISGIIKDDYNSIHTLYYKTYHQNKKK